MYFPRSLALALLAAAPAARAQSLATPLVPADLDAAAFAYSTGGAQSKAGLPLRGPADPNPATFVVWTRASRIEWSGVEFGESKTPGPRHLRVGFTRPIPIGTLLVRGNVSVSALKPDAAYPGALGNEAQWISARRLDARKATGAAAGRDEYALWVLPPGTRTRALRFTHVAPATASRYVGWLGGVWALPDRVANLAPQAQAIAPANDKAAPLLNDGQDNSWSSWSNGADGQAAPVSPQNAPSVVLAWPREVTLRGLCALFAGFGHAQAQVYTGPANRHPREALETDWQTVGDTEVPTSGYPLHLWPHAMDFGREVKTRAVRLRLTAPTREDHGHLNGNTKNGRRVWLGELMALQGLGQSPLSTAILPLAERERPPIPIRFSLPEAGYVTLVIEGASGKRVRNLVAETYFPKGANVVHWDGTDDLGRDTQAASRGIYAIPARFVTPGAYRVRGLWRKKIDLRYEFSVYNPGVPAWETPDKSGGWTTNHTPPSSVLFVPQARDNKDSILIGSYVSEGGAGLAWTDLQGRKYFGVGHVGGNWTGAPYLARAEGGGFGEAYAFVAAAWHNELRLTELRRDGSQRALLLAPWKFDPSQPADAGVIPEGIGNGIAGVAARDGLVVVSMAARNTLLFLDARSRLPLGELALDSPRGVAFDSAGRLLALSGSKLVRLALPADLRAHLDSARGVGAALPRQGWKISASTQAERASLALDGDPATRWDTARGMAPGDSIALDLGAEQAVGGVLMENTNSNGDYARGYEIYVSKDGANWGEPVARGAGSGEATLAPFAAVRARHLKIVQAGADADRYWSLSEIRVLAAPSPSAPRPLPPEVLAENLQDPQGITTDAQNRIYVSERGASHQVRCFDARGKYLRAFGKAGGPKVGKYDPLRMSNPRGLCVDANSRLWVAEEHHQPKRVSVWNPDGSLWKSFLGPSAYGGGGALDPLDKTRFFYNGMQFALDWKAGRDALSHIYYRPEDGFGEPPPEASLSVGGRRYLTNSYNINPTNGSSYAGLWRSMPDGTARLCALAGSANESGLFKALARAPEDFSARYTGQLQARAGGSHLFSLDAGGDARLWIDGKKIVDFWDGPGARSGSADLEAGRRHDIKLEFRRRGKGGARLRLDWEAPGLARQVVPASALFPGIEAAARAGGLSARYFETPDLWDYNGRHATAVEGPLDFDWSTEAPRAFSVIDVAAFAARLPPNFKRGGPLAFLWSDASGDGKPQPDEVSFAPRRADGVVFGPDASITFALFGDEPNSRAVRFAPARFARNGVPIYSFARAQVLAARAQGSPSTGGRQVLAGTNGWAVLSNAPAPFSPFGPGGTRNGVPMWSYPSLWPGLHASHDAPAPDRPGMLIGTTRLLGPMVTPRRGEAGPLWFVNGNMGNAYAMTQDGLFVAELFRDVRAAPLWAMPVARRSMEVGGLSLHDENFWPTVTQAPDGNIYLNSSLPNIVRVDGLESIRRIAPTTIRVTARDLEKAREYFVRAERARQAQSGGGKLAVAIRANSPTIDGKLSEWSGSQWAEIDRRGQEGYFQSNARAYEASAALAIANGRLYAAWKTDEPNLLRNTGEVFNAPFKTGGALDLMLGTDASADPNRAAPVAGDVRLLITRVGEGRAAKVRALIYRAVVPDRAGERVPFSSPWRTVTFDAVSDVSDKVHLAQDGGSYEASVPLEVLGLRPQAGAILKGDVGVLRGDAGQTTARVYWSNKATGITADVPSEAQLSPSLWGRLEVRAAP